MGVSGDQFAIVWLDGQKEMSHLWINSVTGNLSPIHLEKVAAIADLRQEAALEMVDVGLLTAGDTRDRLNGATRKRREAFNTVIRVVKDSPLFTAQGRDYVMALDGKVMIA